MLMFIKKNEFILQPEKWENEHDTFRMTVVGTS